MKKKNFDWGNYPRVGLTFWVVKPFDTRQVAQAILETLEHHGYAFDKLDVGWERNRFVPLQKHINDYYHQWLEVRPKDVGKSVSLRRTRHPRGSMGILVSATGRLPFDLFNIDLEAGYFQEPYHQQNFLRMAQAFYNLLNPAYGMLEYSITRRAKTGPINPEQGLPGVFWGNFLGVEYSNLLSWKRLEELAQELPITVERLPDDGVFILLGGIILESGTEEMLARSYAVERFLGREYFSKTQPSRTLPFSMTDAIHGRVPPEVLHEHLLAPKQKQGKVPEFRFRELRRQRQEDWARSNGMTVEEIKAHLGLELKGPGGVIVVNAETGEGVDLPEEMFGNEIDEEK